MTMSVVAISSSAYSVWTSCGMTRSTLASFAAAWRMVSGLLNARTKERVQAFSAKELPEARARLLEFVDASVLPKRWGGEADDACCLPPIP